MYSASAPSLDVACCRLRAPYLGFKANTSVSHSRIHLRPSRFTIAMFLPFSRLRRDLLGEYDGSDKDQKHKWDGEFEVVHFRPFWVLLL